MCGSKGMKYAEGTKSIKFKKPMMKRANDLNNKINKSLNK